LEAQGFKESKILEAEAEKQSAILRAEAVREQKIREADGEAQAILKIKQAEADGIKMIKDADPTDAVVKIKSLEAFAKAADGQSTKIIIPSEIQSLAGLAGGLEGVLKK
ncbi:MAG: peptidase, partial [Eubacterium sp.]|nr:peptidase [Eubacterium sp.]